MEKLIRTFEGWLMRMVDRYNRAIVIAWSEKEEAYLQAIIAMGCRPKHLRELAELTGRSMDAIKLKMYALRAKAKWEAQEIRAARIFAAISKIPPLPKSFIKPPTPEQLRAGR